MGGWSFTLASVHLKAENWGGKDKTKRLEVLLLDVTL